MARARSNMFVIFALADPGTREYRYLNLSRLDAFESRHQRKLYRAKRGSERYPWIEELRQKNLTPLLIRIATVPAARASSWPPPESRGDDCRPCERPWWRSSRVSRRSAASASAKCMIGCWSRQ